MIAAPPPAIPISQTPVVSANVEKCIAASEQGAGSVTFAAQMTALREAPEMAIRVELETHPTDEHHFLPVAAPGLGVWHDSEPAVKVFRYVAQVTNLAASASYRARVSFRWLNAGGHVVRRASRRTPVCREPPDQRPGGAPVVG